MKAKVFEVMLHKLPSGKSPTNALADQLNVFLTQSQERRAVETCKNTVVAPADPKAMPGSEESTIITFFTLFYTAHEISKNYFKNPRNKTPISGICFENFRTALSPAV